jgi:hypothetical protein
MGSCSSMGNKCQHRLSTKNILTVLCVPMELSSNRLPTVLYRLMGCLDRMYLQCCVGPCSCLLQVCLQYCMAHGATWEIVPVLLRGTIELNMEKMPKILYGLVGCLKIKYLLGCLRNGCRGSFLHRLTECLEIIFLPCCTSLWSRLRNWCQVNCMGSQAV